MAREKAADKRVDAIRLDGGKNTFDDRWGYESLASITENNAITNGGRFLTTTMWFLVVDVLFIPCLIG